MRVFEVGRVFSRDPSVTVSDSTVQGVSQPMRVAGAVFGSAHRQGGQGKQAPVDFYDVKGDVEALLSPH